MYPFALELQYKKAFVREFEKIALPFTRAVIERLRSEVRVDSDESIKADSLPEMLEFIRKLRAEHGDRIDSAKLEKIIDKNFHLIDAWSRDKTNEMLGKMYSRLNTPQLPNVTGRPTPAGKSGELWMTTVNPRNNLNESLISDTVKRNVKLIHEDHKQHFNDIERIIRDGVFSGKGHRVIAKELTDATGVHISKTSFWARDQVSKFHGETTKIRQQEAGIKGFVWRCVGDNVTRDRHLMLEGTYHDWNNPPVVDNKGKRAIPGEDYNCRCWSEPALGPEFADREYGGPIDDNYFEKVRPGIENNPGLSSGKIGDTDGESIITNVESINFKNKKAVEKVFDDFAIQHADSKIEYAKVVSPKNKVFTVKGTDISVNIDLVGDEILKGAKVIHNHPTDGIFIGDCFSLYDLRKYFEKGLSEILVTNSLGMYTFSTKSKKRLTPEQMSELYQLTLRELWGIEEQAILDIKDEQLKIMKLLAKNNKFIKFKKVKK
jgi:SPP1 gp7 family putative phage head morphogenesis protein